jgi:UDP-N-acetylglucosamine 2-epimerase (non-hydrolysing)
MKIMTILGTRPEIIRLYCVIQKLDKFCSHILVHTGQNYDYELNKVFFDDLDLREPDYILNVKANKIYKQLSNIFEQTGKIIEKEKPDAILVLGDTNSALSVINAKRFKIPIYHMEAGDRSFDENVPEEINRRIVDHVSDILLPYTEHSRRNLLMEGIHPRRIFVTGSPIKEVYIHMEKKFKKSSILKKLKLTPKKYIVASIHREENVDKKGGLKLMVNSYSALAKKYALPVVVSTHPRTLKRLKELDLIKSSHSNIIWHKPFGLIDYIWLQKNSLCVVSDSGTIHEDASILNFPAIAIRKSTEKRESLEAGHVVITGLEPDDVLRSVDFLLNDKIKINELPMPSDYNVDNVSSKVVNIILSMNKIVDELVWGDPDKKYI